MANKSKNKYIGVIVVEVGQRILILGPIISHKRSVSEITYSLELSQYLVSPQLWVKMKIGYAHKIMCPLEEPIISGFICIFFHQMLLLSNVLHKIYAIKLLIYYRR